MQPNELILAEEFCTNNNIGFSFITSLNEYGLIEITLIEETQYIPESQLQRLEQLIRLHYDLQINFEGLDVVCHLLDKVKTLQMEVARLKNRVQVFEQELYE